MCLQSEDLTTRLASASFLASFLARYTRLPPKAVLASLTQLATFAQNYSRTHAPPPRHASSFHLPSKGGALQAPSRHSVGASASTAGATLNRSSTAEPAAAHEVFYAACQAILYSLCYHMGAVDGGADELPSLLEFVKSEVVPILRSPLEPLQSCLPSASQEFVRQAAASGVSDISDFLSNEYNPPSIASIKRPFEMFFPFDPYLLPLSLPLLGLEFGYRRWHNGQVVARAPSTPASSPPSTPTSSPSHSWAASEDPANHLQRSSPPMRLPESSRNVSSRECSAPRNVNPFALPQHTDVPTQQPVFALCASSPSDHGFIHGASYASSLGGPRIGSGTPRGSAAMSLSDPIDYMSAVRQGAAGDSGSLICVASSADHVMGCTPDTRLHHYL